MRPWIDVHGLFFGTEGIPAEELAPLAAAYKASGGSLATRSQPLTAELVAGRFGK